MSAALSEDHIEQILIEEFLGLGYVYMNWKEIWGKKNNSIIVYEYNGYTFKNLNEYTDTDDSDE